MSLKIFETDSRDAIKSKFSRWIPEARKEDLFPAFCKYTLKISISTFKIFLGAGMKFDEKTLIGSQEHLRNLGRIAYLYISQDLHEQIPVHLLNFKVINSAISWPHTCEQKVMLKYIKESGWYQNDLICARLYALGIHDIDYDPYFKWSVKNGSKIPKKIARKCGNINALKYFHEKGRAVITAANREYNVLYNCNECVTYIDKFLKQ